MPSAAAAPPTRRRDNPPTCSIRRTEFFAPAERNPTHWADDKSNAKSAPDAPVIPTDTERQKAFGPPSTPHCRIAPHPCPDISRAESAPEPQSPPRWNRPAHDHSSARHCATANPPTYTDSATRCPNMECRPPPSLDRYKNQPSLSPLSRRQPELPASHPAIAKTPVPLRIRESPMPIRVSTC